MKFKLNRKVFIRHYQEVHKFGKHISFERSKKFSFRINIKGCVNNKCIKTRGVYFGDKFIIFRVGYPNEGISSHVNIKCSKRLKHTS